MGKQNVIDVRGRPAFGTHVGLSSAMDGVAGVQAEAVSEWRVREEGGRDQGRHSMYEAVINSRQTKVVAKDAAYRKGLSCHARAGDEPRVQEAADQSIVNGTQPLTCRTRVATKT